MGPASRVRGLIGLPMNRGHIRAALALGVAATAFALSLACTGCDYSLPPAVHGTAKNDAFLEGQIDPAEIQSLVVYVSFKAWGWSMDGADRSPAVTINDREAIQELCAALASEYKWFEPEDEKTPSKKGVIEARLIDGTKVFIEYFNRGGATDISSPPTSIDRIHYRRYPSALASWLNAYVYE